MAAKKKAKKAKKKTPARKVATRSARPKPTKKKSAKKKAAKKARPKIAPKRSVAAKSGSAPRPGAQRQTRDSVFEEPRRERAWLGDADSQGLSTKEGADSESVEELLEEGNAFEAGVVEGVEQADDADEREVRTREFPEDDVPEEYLEKD
jgi:hypothetical protein